MPGIEWVSTCDNKGFIRSMNEMTAQVKQAKAVIDAMNTDAESAMNRLNGVGRDLVGTLREIGAVAGVSFSIAQAKSFVDKIVETRGYFQDIESSMKVFLGNEQKAKDFTDKLRGYSYYNMYEFSDLANASKQMIAYGNDVDSIIPRLDQLSNVARGTSAPLMEMVNAYNHAKNLGGVGSRELQSWAAKGLVIKDILKEMGEEVEGTSVSFEQLNKVLDHVTGEGGMFHNLMGEQLNNITAEQGQLEDNLTAMYNEIGEKYQDTITGVIKAESWMVDHYKEVGTTIMSLVAAYGEYRAVMIASKAIENVKQKTVANYEIEELEREIDKYKELLVEKDNAKNADLAEAVAKGKLTEEQASLIAAKRAELEQVQIEKELLGVDEKINELQRLKLDEDLQEKVATEQLTLAQGQEVQKKRELVRALDEEIAKRKEAELAKVSSSMDENDSIMSEIRKKIEHNNTDIQKYEEEIEKRDELISRLEIQGGKEEEINRLQLERQALIDKEIRLQEYNIENEERLQKLDQENAELNQRSLDVIMRYGTDDEKLSQLHEMLMLKKDELAIAEEEALKKKEEYNTLIQHRLEEEEKLQKMKEQLEIQRAINEEKSKNGGATSDLTTFSQQVEDQQAIVDALNDETSAKEENSAATAMQEAAEKAQSIQEQISTLEEQANTIATGTNAKAKTGNTMATNALTVSERIHNAALAAGTVASRIFSTAINQVKTAIKGLGAAMMTNPIGVLIGALTIGIPWLMEWISGTDDAADAEKRYGNEAKEAESKVKSLINVIETADKSSKIYKDSVSELERIYKDYGIEVEKTKDSQNKEVVSVQSLIDKHSELVDVLRQEAIERQKYNDMDSAAKDYESSAEEDAIKFKKRLDEKVFSSSDKNFIVNMVDEELVQKAGEELLKYQEIIKRLGKVYGTSAHNQKEAREQLVVYHKAVEDASSLAKEYASATTDDEEAIKDFNRELNTYINNLALHKAEQLSANKAAEEAAVNAWKVSDANANLAREVRYAKMSTSQLKDELKHLVQAYGNTQLNVDIIFRQENVPDWIKGMDIDRLKSESSKWTVALGNQTGWQVIIDGKAYSREEAAKTAAMLTGERERQEKAKAAADEEAKRKEEERKKNAERNRQKAENERLSYRKRLFDQQMADIERRRKQQQDMEEAQADLAIASEQSRARRELMQMEKDHKNKLEAIDRQAEEMRKANYEAQKKAWEAENAGNKKAVWADTATAKKVLADGNYSSVALTKEQDATLEAQRKARLAENERAEKEYYDKIVAAHQSYADKKIAIDRKYNEDVAEIREALAKAEASGNKSGAEALRRSLGETEKEHAKSQAQLSLEILKDDPEYIRAFEDLDEASTATLEHLIKLFEESKSAAAKSLDPKDLREYTSAIDQMRDKLNERDPFKALTESSHRLKEKRNELKNAEKQLAQVEEGALIPVGVTLNRATMQLETQYLSLDDAQKRVREATGNLTEEEEKHLKIVEASNEEINSLAEAIGNLGNSIGGQAGSILTLGSQVLSFYTLTTDSITKLSKTGEAALSSLEKASVILTIISAAWQLAQGIMSLFGESEEERQARLRREEMVREMTASVEAYRLEVIRARQEEEKWLASSGLRDLADSWKLSSEAQKSYFEVANNQTNRMKKDIAHWETYDIPTLTNINRQAFFNQYYMSLEQFGHAFDIEIANEYDQLETLSSYIKRVYNADMFDSEGMLNTAVIDNFLESNSDRIQHDDEEILKTLNDLSKQYAEWRENLKKYVADQFGGFSDDLVDSLWAWYDEGSDVMESFRSNARDTFRGVASDMMKDLVNNVVFDQLKERLTDAFSAYSLNINSGMGASEAIALLATSVDGALGDFETTVEGQLPVLKSLMEQLGQMSDSLFGKADADDAKEYFNSIRDAWADTVMAMKGDSESLGKEIARIMFESLVASNIFNDTFDEWLKGWVASYNEALALEDEVARQERLADLAQQRADKVDELTAATKEYADITGYAAETTEEFSSSLDNLGDTLLDALLDTEKDAAAMGREIASTLVREMLQTMLASEQYAGRMEEIRGKWKQILSGEGGGYTMDDVLRDIADLNNDIANDEGIAALADQYRGLQKELEGTETAFGDLRGTFLDTLTDMEGDAEAFRRKMEEVMLKDLLDKQVLGGAFTAGLDGIVREFADFDDYAEQWNRLYADAVKEGNGEVIDALLDELAAVRGQMVESAEGLRERMKALSEDTTFKGMSDNFASTLLDMDAKAEDFGRQIGRTLVEKMVRELIVGKKLQSYLDDIQAAYDRASKDFEGIEDPVERTQRIIEAVTPSIDAAVAATEEWKPVVEAIAESFGELGGTPFDNMRSSFLSSLMDMESSTEDFARSIGEMLTEAFVDKFVLGDTFDAQLESWQAEYRRIMGDTSMDDEERSRQLNALKALIADYRDQMAGEAMAIHDLMGTAEYADQQATMNMADKITYEQADMLLGVNVAQQLIQQQILATLQSMRGVTNPDSQVFSDMRNLMFQANGHLTWIHYYSKRIYDDFSGRLASIDDKLSLLR